MLPQMFSNVSPNSTPVSDAKYAHDIFARSAESSITGIERLVHG